MADADKNYFDGAKTYKVTLPKDIPARTSAVHALRQPEPLDARHPAATARGKPSYPSPAAEANARAHNRVLQPDAARRNQAWQLDPDRSEKGYFAILRLYGPLEPFFTKTWRPRRSRWF
jgi:hypothetical protein